MTKKIIKNILFIIIMLFPIITNAKGSITASPESLTIEVGSSKTFTINSNNSVGDVTINNSDTSIISIDKNEWETGIVESGEKKSGTITVTALKIGSATLTLNIDGATFDNEDLSGQTKKIYVNVIEKQTGTSKKSDNNKLKELSVEGFNIKKIDNSNYKLNVGDNVSSIKIKAIAEHSKATVSGAGEHKLKTGSNKFDIIVTSQSGKLNVITLTVYKETNTKIEEEEEQDKEPEKPVEEDQTPNEEVDLIDIIDNNALLIGIVVTVLLVISIIVMKLKNKRK